MADVPVDRPKGKSLRPLRALVPFLAPHWRVLAAALAALLVAAAAQLALPIALRYLIDEGLKGEDNTMVRKGWRIVEKNQEKISNLVMDMLTFSKDREPELVPGDLNEIVSDVVELMRAACAVVQGALAEVQTIVALPSGYHRDLQLTKGPTMRGLDEALATSRLLPRLIEGLAFDRARMAAAVTPECFATDRAVELAIAGVPFREAYRQVAAEIAALPAGDAAASLRARVSLGAPGNLALDELARRIDASAR